MLLIGAAWTGAITAYGRLANDVLTLSRPEIGELGERPEPGRGGSSTMPHKTNPTLAVLLRRAALTAPALQSLLQLAAADSQDERPDGAWHVEWQPLQLLARHTLTAADQFSELTSGLTVDVAATARNLAAARPGVDSEAIGLAALTANAAAASSGVGSPAVDALLAGGDLDESGVMTPSLTLVRPTTAASGRPLLVLGPSLGTSVRTLWGRCAAELADRLDVVGWELPGHGHGSPIRDAVSIAELASAVLQAVDSVAAAGTPFHVAGDSIGGAVALQLALDHPQRVLSATLACTGARIGSPDQWRERAATVRSAGTSAVVEASARRWFGPGFLEREPAAGAALLAALTEADDESYALLCGALADFDVRGRLTELATPLTLIGGNHDMATPVSGLREIAEAVPGSRLIELPIAHLAPAEDPVTTAALIAAAGGVGAAPSVGVAPGVGTAASGGQRRAAGLQVRREVAGSGWVDAALAGTTTFTAEFQDFITRYAWGEVWTRPGLDRRSRSMDHADGAGRRRPPRGTRDARPRSAHQRALARGDRRGAVADRDLLRRPARELGIPGGLAGVRRDRPGHVRVTPVGRARTRSGPQRPGRGRPASDRSAAGGS